MDQARLIMALAGVCYNMDPSCIDLWVTLHKYHVVNSVELLDPPTVDTRLIRHCVLASVTELNQIDQAH